LAEGYIKATVSLNSQKDIKISSKQDKPKGINWHRPLGENELSRRYLRGRWSEVSEEHLIPPEELEDPIDADQYDRYLIDWNLLDPFYRLDYVIRQAWFKLLDFGEITEVGQAFKKAGWKFTAELKHKAPETDQGVKTQAPIHDLEFELVKHIHFLGELEEGSPQRNVHSEDLEIIHDLVTSDPRHEESPFLLCLLFSPFWVRTPRSWVPPSEGNQLLSLVEHLFKIYEPPVNFLSAWTYPVAETRYKWIAFYIILAQGGKLKKAGQYFSWRIRKGFTQNLFKVEAGLNPMLSALQAHIFSLGGTAKEYERISRNRGLVIDPTELIEEWVDGHFYPFFERTVKWLIRKREEFTDDEIDRILEWAVHMHTQTLYTDTEFSWRGRSDARIREAADEYYRARIGGWENLNWKAHGWDWEYVDVLQTKWVFKELSTGQELFKEGNALHHCVSGYAERCATSRSAIVSISENGVKLLTVEVNPGTKEIIQVRGFQNRIPNRSESRVIELWEAEVLSH